MDKIIRLFILLACAASGFGQTLTSDSGSSIPAAIRSLKGAGGLVIVNRSYISNATVFIPSYTTVSCLPNVTVTQTDKTHDVFAFQPGSVHMSLQGCRTAGGNNAIAGFGLNFYSIAGNTFTAWHASGIAIGANSYNGMITGDSVIQGSPGCSDPIFVQDNGSTLAIEDSVIDSAGCAGAHGIAVHTYVMGGQSQRLTIRNNFINHFSDNFPIEAGQFGMGSIVDGCMVSGNHIFMSAKGNGGISLSGTLHCTASDNEINMGGFLPGIAGIELANASYTTAHGNHIWNGAPNANALVIDSTSGSTVTGNDINGQVIVVNSGTFLGITDLSNNIIAENAITSASRAVWLQCNVENCLAQNNAINMNVITGTGLHAIFLENDKGTVNGTQVLYNRAAGFGTLLLQGPGVTGTQSN